MYVTQAVTVLTMWMSTSKDIPYSAKPAETVQNKLGIIMVASTFGSYLQTTLSSFLNSRNLRSLICKE